MKSIHSLMSRCVGVVAACCLMSSALFSGSSDGLAGWLATDAAAQTATPCAVFTDIAVQAGVPLHVAMENATPETLTYAWTVDGKKIDNTSSSYTPTEEDYEKIIAATVTADGTEYTCSMYFSTLPVVYIDTDNGQAITSKEEYISASCQIQGNDTFCEAAQLYNGSIQIRGRGNYTWEHDKKPYKIKLDTKTDLFGLGENKHWVLIAEYMDPTHLRNEIMPEISETLGMEYTANGQAVILMLNGSYNGLYHLSENVRIDSNRVNIYDWEETAEDIAKAVYKQEKAGGMTKEQRDALEQQLVQNLEWVTTGTFTYLQKSYTVSDYVTLPDSIDGGYLLELDTYDDYHTAQVSDFNTDGDQPIQFKSPEYAKTNDTMFQYAADYIQSFENAVSAADYYTTYNGKDAHYSDLFDMDSLVQYWLMLELTANSDGMRYSNYMYKDFGKPFQIGPAWDYDWTWNAGYTVPENEWWTDQSYYNDTIHWYKYLAKDPYFITKAYTLYNSKKADFAEIYADGGKIDTYSARLSIPAKADCAKWYSTTDYDEEVSKTKTYVTNRYTWLDEQFTSVEKLSASLGYTASDKLTVADIQSDGSSVTMTAQVTDDTAKAVTFHINGKAAGSAAVQNGTASIQVSRSLLETDPDALNAVQIRLQDTNGTYLTETSDTGSSNHNWGGNNWDNFWGQQSEQQTSAEVVISNFAVFTAAELGLQAELTGDVNLDGTFDLQDVVLVQKWLLHTPDTTLPHWKNGDLTGDNRLNGLDLVRMRQALLQ